MSPWRQFWSSMPENVSFDLKYQFFRPDVQWFLLQVQQLERLK